MTTLFLKYRPQTFSDLVGQEAVVKTLQNALKSDKPAHAYLFVGSRGTGKTSTARLLSKGLNCLNLQNGAPCGQCDICKSTADGSLVDVIEIDAASHTGVDNIRDLREKANFMPNIAKRKIYIIDEVHMLSKGAFNALLKTLEEPPAHAFFILATTEFDKVPETIVSRCQTFTFRRFTLQQLVDRLEMISQAENFTTTREALELIARKAEGGLRDAISLLEQLSAETTQNITADSVRNSLGISSTQQLENFYTSLQEKNADKAFAVLKEINQQGGDFRSFGHDFLNFLREKMYNNLNNPTQLSQLISQIEAIETALSRFKTSPLVELPLEIAVVKLCATQNSSSTTPTLEETNVTPSSITPKPPTPPAPKKPAAPPQPQPTTKSSDFVFDDEQPSTPTTPAPEEKKSPLSSPKPETTTAISSSIIKENLKEIAEQSSLPTFVKKSLLTTTPHLEEKTLTFKSSSQFHCEQLQKSKIEPQINTALNKLFGCENLTIKFTTISAKIDDSQEKAATVADLEF